MGLKKFTENLSNFRRRKRSVESYEWWEHLNYAQKFSVSSLYKFGYDIRFVRTENQESTVVMSLEGKFATVDQEGLINTDPDLQIRHNS